MGLDNFWVDPETKEPFPPEKLPAGADSLQLCGGIFSSHGQGSFRGKVYAAFIEDVADVSLFHDLDNETVLVVAERLERVIEEGGLARLSDEYDRPQDEKELGDLARMFRMYGDAGAALVAWW